MSGPVSSGFTSAVAVLIITSQLRDLFGIKGGGTTFPQMIGYLIANIGDIQYADTILGVVCIVILLLLRVSMHIKLLHFQLRVTFSFFVNYYFHTNKHTEHFGNLFT